MWRKWKLQTVSFVSKRNFPFSRFLSSKSSLFRVWNNFFLEFEIIPLKWETLIERERETVELKVKRRELRGNEKMNGALKMVRLTRILSLFTHSLFPFPSLSLSLSLICIKLSYSINVTISPTTKCMKRFGFPKNHTRLKYVIFLPLSFSQLFVTWITSKNQYEKKIECKN